MRILMPLVVLSSSLFGSFYSDNINAYVTIKKGYISVYSKKSNKIIKRAKLVEKGSEIDAKPKEKAFYLDFNFDGKKDLAIVDSQSGGFSSYVGLIKSKNSFVFNEDLSSALSEIDSFELKPKKRVLITYHTMGHSVNYESHYKVVHGKFINIKDVEEAYSGYDPYIITITTSHKQGKNIQKVARELQLGGNFELASFRLKKSGKRVYIFNCCDGLNYALTKPSKDKDYAKVEFNYPIGYPSEKEQEPIVIKRSKNSVELRFSNQNAHYTVYQNSKNGKVKSVGVRVKVGSKKYDLQGDVKSLRGSLQKAGIK